MPQSSTIQEKSKEYLEINLPRLSFSKNHFNPYFAIITLIILSFLLGMLTNKILFLQSDIKKEITSATQQAFNSNTANAPAQPTPPEKVDVEPGSLPILGNSNAPITIVEFSDFQCPFCKQFFDNTFGRINDEYIKTGKAKLTYRHYALTTIHPNAQKAAEASECANDQNKFWEYHDILFKNQALWSPLADEEALNSFTNYAGELNLNTDEFRGCLSNNKHQAKVNKDQTDGVDAYVDGTPAFFINGWRLTGSQPFPAFKELIDKELKN